MAKSARAVAQDRAAGGGERRSGRGPRLVRVVERLLLAGGLLLLAGLIYELDAAAVAANLALVGWGIVPIVGQEILAYAANAFGWLMAFGLPRPPIPFREILAARIAGDAVNYATPTATLGGELVRVRFLRGRAAGTAVVASVAVAKLAQTIAQVLFVVVGMVAALEYMPLDPSLRRALPPSLALFAALVVLLLVAQRRGMFVPLLRLAQRLGMASRAPELLDRLRHLDEAIARVHRQAGGALWLSTGGFFAGWLAGVLEIYLILWFLDVPVSVRGALGIEALSVAIDGILFFVPFKAGTQEGGKVLIFTVLGLDPAKGLALGLLRRLRELAWAGIGLAIYWRRQRNAGQRSTDS